MAIIEAAHANDPRWSADSSYLYLDPEGPESNLRRVRVADGLIETVLDLSRYWVPWAGIAPDDAPLVLRKLSDIYALELERR